MTLCKTYVTGVDIRDLDTGLAGESVCLQIRNFGPDGQLSDRVEGKTRPLPTQSSLLWHSMDIITTATRFAVIVLSASGSPIAYSQIEVNPEISYSTIDAPLLVDTPTFTTGKISVTCVCTKALYLAFRPTAVIVGKSEQFGSVIPALENLQYYVQMRILEGSKQIGEKIISDPITPMLVGRHLLVRSGGTLSNCIYVRDYTRVKVELSVVRETTGESELIEIVRLANLQLEVTRHVGTFGGSTFTMSRDFIAPSQTTKTFSFKDMDYFFKNGKFEKFQFSDFKISFFDFPKSCLGGELRYTLAGLGVEHKICLAGNTKSVKISDIAKVEFSMRIYVGNEIPVIAFIAIDSCNRTAGVYSVPLGQDQHMFFPHDQVSIKIESTKDENDEIYLPVLDKCPTVEIPQFVQTRLFCTVEQAVKLPTIAASTFVTVRSVRSSVPPVLLRATDLLTLQSPEPLTEYETFTTAARDYTCAPRWFVDGEIDLKWKAEDWLYFMIFDYNKSSTVLVGHACVPFNRCLVASGTLELPLVDSKTHMTYPDSFLCVSFPKDPIPWSDILVSQLSGQKMPIAGELMLKVFVHRSRSDRTSVLRENHRWLPIKDVYPLVLRECPPSGYVTLTLSPLNGSILAESTHKISPRDNVLSCGTLRFSFSRRHNS